MTVIIALGVTAWTWRTYLGAQITAAVIPIRVLPVAPALALGADLLAPLEPHAALVPHGTGATVGAHAAQAGTAPAHHAAIATDGQRWKVKHDGYITVSGGILVIPDNLAALTTSGAGEYDLIIHFHGDVAIVRQSV